MDIDPDHTITMVEGTQVFPMDGIVPGATFFELFKDAPNFRSPVNRIMLANVSGDITEELEYQGNWFRCRYTPMFAKPRTLSLSDSKNPVVSQRGVIGIVLTAADCTERYLAEIALRDTNREKSELEERESAALKATKIKSTFLANASHEIRTYVS